MLSILTLLPWLVLQAITAHPRLRLLCPLLTHSLVSPRCHLRMQTAWAQRDTRAAHGMCKLAWLENKWGGSRQVKAIFWVQLVMSSRSSRGCGGLCVLRWAGDWGLGSG